MSRRRNAHSGSLLVVILIIIIGVGTFAGIEIYQPGLIPLAVPVSCTGFPTNPALNGCYGFTTFHYCVNGGGVPCKAASAVSKMNGCTDPFNGANVCGLYTASGGVLNIPMGMEADAKRECAVQCSTYSWYWYVLDPPGLPLACTGLVSGTCSDTNGMDVKVTETGQPGGYLLTSPTPAGDPTCSNFAGHTSDQGNSNPCWTNDFAVIQAACAANPQGCGVQGLVTNPCAQGVTICFYLKASTPLSPTDALNYLQSPAPAGPGYNATYSQALVTYCQNNPKGTGCPISKTTTNNWYLYRTVTSLQLQMIPPAVQVQCYLTNGVNCLANCYLFICVNTNADLQGWVQGTVIPELNLVGQLTNTRVVFGLSTSQFLPVFSNSCGAPGGFTNCFWGITGAWIGGQGIQTSGCTAGNVVNCGPSNFVQQKQGQLSLYSCPNGPVDSSCPAAVSAADIYNIAQATNQTIQQVTQNNVYGTIYSSLDTNNLGYNYGFGGANCTVGNLPGCISNPNPIVINVPIVFDIMGSYTSYFFQYPQVPPNGGGTGGTISGQVIDASSKNLLGQYSPLVNACVSTNAPSTCTGGGGAAVPTDQNGNYQMSNLTPGTYIVCASAPNYVPICNNQVTVSTGTVSKVPFALNPLNPPGQDCVIAPSNNFPYPPTPGFLCVPSYVKWILLAIVVGLGVIIALAWSPFGGALVGGTLGGLGSLVGRARGNRGQKTRHTNIRPG